MRLVEPLSEHDMVAYFLKHEINSERFGREIISLLNLQDKPGSIVDQPDTRNADEHDYRAQLLGNARDIRRTRAYLPVFRGM